MLNWTSASRSIWYVSSLWHFPTFSHRRQSLQSWLKKNTHKYCISVLGSLSLTPLVTLLVCSAGLLEDRLSGFALCFSLSLLMLYHLLAGYLVLAQGLLLPPLAPGLHPRYQTEHGSAEDWGDACQVEGHVVAAKSVPQETCKQTKKSGCYWESMWTQIKADTDKPSIQCSIDSCWLYNTLKSQVISCDLAWGFDQQSEHRPHWSLWGSTINWVIWGRLVYRIYTTISLNISTVDFWPAVSKHEFDSNQWCGFSCACEHSSRHLFSSRKIQTFCPQAFMWESFLEQHWIYNWPMTSLVAESWINSHTFFISRKENAVQSLAFTYVV